METPPHVMPLIATPTTICPLVCGYNVLTVSLFLLLSNSSFLLAALVIKTEKHELCHAALQHTVLSVMITSTSLPALIGLPVRSGSA